MAEDFNKKINHFNEIQTDKIYTGSDALYINEQLVLNESDNTINMKSNKDINIQTTESGITKVNSVEKVQLDSKDISINGTENINLIGKNILLDGITTITNLNITGQTTNIVSEDLSIQDNIIELNKGESQAGVSKVTAGIIINRGLEESYYMIFDESDDKFKIGVKNNLQIVETKDYVDAELNLKQDIIDDLSIIRDGAAKGATALQEHQDISYKANLANTLSGYGITDAYTKDELDNFLGNKANTNHGNHVPEIEAEIANNRLLRNDNTWVTVTPEDIGAQPSGDYSTLEETIKSITLSDHTLTITRADDTTSTIIIPDENNWRPVIDNLGTDNPDVSLSAKQGKFLYELIEELQRCKAETSVVVERPAGQGVGNTTQGVYIALNGVATAMTYELNKTVPANAVFTDTTYTANTGLKLDGTTFKHTNAITAGTAGTNAAIAQVKTLKIPYIEYDEQGHITLAKTISQDIYNSEIAEKIVNTSKANTNLITANISDTDIFTLKTGKDTNNSFSEIAMTGSKLNPIFIKQYVNGTLKNEAQILDQDGNTSFPNKLKGKTLSVNDKVYLEYDERNKCLNFVFN